MQISTLSSSLLGNLSDQVPCALTEKGWGVFDHALPEELAEALLTESRHNEESLYKPAGTGREGLHQTETEVRADDMQWLKGTTETQSQYLDLMEQLRTFLNRELFLGLFDYECLFARYLEGAFYKTHRDAFVGERNRVLSTVLYLNPRWQESDGGQLVLYRQDETTELARILPEHNRLVLFLSEQFPHEVLPAGRSRYSLTGWFRVNSPEGWKRPV